MSYRMNAGTRSDSVPLRFGFSAASVITACIQQAQQRAAAVAVVHERLVVDARVVDMSPLVSIMVRCVN